VFAELPKADTANDIQCLLPWNVDHADLNAQLNKSK
jgi:hypothetical protein